MQAAIRDKPADREGTYSGGGRTTVRVMPASRAKCRLRVTTGSVPRYPATARARIPKQAGKKPAPHGIQVGVGTVLADDPQLTCRMEGGRNPLRLVCDTHLRTPLTAQVVKTAGELPTCLATCVTQEGRLAPYRDLGVQILPLPQGADGRVDLAALVTLLGKMGVDSVLAEGGAQLHWGLVQAGLVNRVQAYLAPKLLGGQGAKSPVGGQGFPHPDQALSLSSPTLTRLGEDILLESEVTG